MPSDKDRLRQVFDHIDSIKAREYPAIVGSDKGHQLVERPWKDMPERAKLAILQDSVDWTGITNRDQAHILLGQVDPGKIADAQRNRLIDAATRSTLGIEDDDRPMTPGEWNAWRDDVMAEDRAIRVMTYGEDHVAKMEAEARQRAAGEQPSPPPAVPAISEAELSEMERGWSQPQVSDTKRPEFSELLRLPATRADTRSDFQRLLDEAGERVKTTQTKDRDRGGPER